jgi:hypothetical protein
MISAPAPSPTLRALDSVSEVAENDVRVDVVLDVVVAV